LRHADFWSSALAAEDPHPWFEVEMCGIAGVFGERNPELVGRMTQAMLLRGPDDEGHYVGEGVSLGMRRLSIIDLSTGHQPISNEDGTLTIVFNGEIYNYLELRADLLARGHQFTTRTDTEVILHLFEEKRAETPAFLRGDFAFAIWDSRASEGFLVRDHLGVKPLYYAPGPGRVVFASELKALMKDGRIVRDLDPHAVDAYLTLMYVPAPLTAWRNVYKLPPGSMLKYTRSGYSIARYWAPPKDVPAPRRQEEFQEAISERFREAVAIRLMSDVPLGVFLSGGMDSSSIVAMMRRSGVERIGTFSVGYGPGFSSFDELEFSRQVARHFATSHHELVITPDIRKTAVEVVTAMDEPLADSSAIPTFLISRETAKHVKVVLSGIGGDEFFAGYPRYLGAVWAGYYERVPRAVRQGLARLAPWVPEQESSRNIGGWLRRFLAEAVAPPLDQYCRWMTLFSPAERSRLCTPEFRMRTAGRGDGDLLLRLGRETQARDLADQVCYIDASSYLVDDLLYMGDRMSMANSLELRVPFCDHRLAEELIRTGWRQRMGPFSLKRLLKRIMRHDLPRATLTRKKQGFMIPVGAWMKNELLDLLRNYLAPDRLRRQGMFEPSEVQLLLDSHLSGRARKTNQLWALLVFQMWSEKAGC
jgi:asparagine synthase (glutamine-hydrolysing)